MAIATGRRGMGGIAREARGRGQVEAHWIWVSGRVIEENKILQQGRFAIPVKYFFLPTRTL